MFEPQEAQENQNQEQGQEQSNPFLIDVRLAAQQEVRARQQHAMTLLLAGAFFIIVSVASFFGLILPVTVLAIFVLVFFYVKNQKEIVRLVNQYE